MAFEDRCSPQGAPSPPGIPQSPHNNSQSSSSSSSSPSSTQSSASQTGYCTIIKNTPSNHEMSLNASPVSASSSLSSPADDSQTIYKKQNNNKYYITQELQEDTISLTSKSIQNERILLPKIIQEEKMDQEENDDEEQEDHHQNHNHRRRRGHHNSHRNHQQQPALHFSITNILSEHFGKIKNRKNNDRKLLCQQQQRNEEYITNNIVRQRTTTNIHQTLFRPYEIPDNITKPFNLNDDIDVEVDDDDELDDRHDDNRLIKLNKTIPSSSMLFKDSILDFSKMNPAQSSHNNIHNKYNTINTNNDYNINQKYYNPFNLTAYATAMAKNSNLHHQQHTAELFTNNNINTNNNNNRQIYQNTQQFLNDSLYSKIPPLGNLCKTVSQIGVINHNHNNNNNNNSISSNGQFHRNNSSPDDLIQTRMESSLSPNLNSNNNNSNNNDNNNNTNNRQSNSKTSQQKQNVAIKHAQQINNQQQQQQQPSSSLDSGMESSDDAKSETGSVKDSENGAQSWPAWVYCTRYSDRPSSGPRYRKPKVPKDKSAPIPDEKRPRTAFSSDQLARLKREFTENRYLNETRRLQLSTELGLNEAQIKIWFQNKRAKIKKSTGHKNPLALQLMAQGLYNHSTVPLTKEEEELELRMQLHNRQM